MTREHQHVDEGNLSRSRSSIAKLVLVGFMIVAGYFLFTEHRAHLGGVLYYLPFLFLLACPFMHIFMHGGHGSRDHDTHDGDTRKGNS